MPKRVTFFSDGIQLVGYIYLPPDLEPGAPRSGILICHGFGAHQARFVPEIAQHLAAQGYVAMTFDYRGFGESDGPRWRMIPQEQVVDIGNALTFLQLQPEVEPASVGLYGPSFGGANVCYVAGVDPRVKCVVSTVGVGCGERWLRSLRRAWEWEALMKELEEDNRQRVMTGQSRLVDRLYIMLPDPETKATADLGAQRFPDVCTHMPLETVGAVMRFHPEEVVDRIAPRPVLFIVAENDVLVLPEITRELYDRAGEPKRWAIIPGTTHYETYAPPAFHRVMAEATAWYQEHLPATPRKPQSQDPVALAGVGHVTSR